MYENIKINCTEIDIKNCKYDKSFIKNAIERENEDANDLVENVLKLNLNETLNVNDALAHSFFKEKMINDANVIIKTKKFIDGDTDKRLSLLAKCQKCKNIKNEKCNDEKIKCNKCCNYFHKKCFGECNCDGKYNENDLLIYLEIGKYIKGRMYFNEEINMYDFSKVRKNKSVYDALKDQKLTFNDDLFYKDDSEMFNNAILLPYYVEASKELIDIYNKTKYYTRIIIYPFDIGFKTKIGYYAFASTDINKNTLLCEYAGDVMNFGESMSIENDLKFELITSYSNDCSSIIVPYIHEMEQSIYQG